MTIREEANSSDDAAGAGGGVCPALSLCSFVVLAWHPGEGFKPAPQWCHIFSLVFRSKCSNNLQNYARHSAKECRLDEICNCMP